MVSSINRSMHGVDSRGESSLELEAIAAVHELSYAVQSISVSEMLPRTPDLIFVNVTTLEAQPYCLELTLKGWRICSLRHDCMTGDFTRLDLFTKYFDSLKSLMEEISASYHDLSFERLEQKLRLILDNGEDNNGILAPASSYAGTPVLCHSPRSHSRNMLATATLRTSCASTN
ncbi:hypothetical protein AB6A40_009438 [Gnathostoma spinigerum]|uniref:GSKIP domain-containing protein n=1 Tax=Gnathostoma spinigerum TaxID=75299 RepID=A0ABD6EZI9_9BILA